LEWNGVKMETDGKLWKTVGITSRFWGKIHRTENPALYAYDNYTSSLEGGVLTQPFEQDG